jgi:hypothetical protein
MMGAIIECRPPAGADKGPPPTARADSRRRRCLQIGQISPALVFIVVVGGGCGHLFGERAALECHTRHIFARLGLASRPASQPEGRACVCDKRPFSGWPPVAPVSMPSHERPPNRLAWRWAGARAARLGRRRAPRARFLRKVLAGDFKVGGQCSHCCVARFAETAERRWPDAGRQKSALPPPLLPARLI